MSIAGIIILPTLYLIIRLILLFRRLRQMRLMTDMAYYMGAGESWFSWFGRQLKK